MRVHTFAHKIKLCLCYLCNDTKITKSMKTKSTKIKLKVAIILIKINGQNLRASNFN